MSVKPRAALFGYGDMGILGLKSLREAGFDVTLVVTHEDAPGEKIWFGSLKKTAQDMGLAVITPEDPKSPELLRAVQNAAPEFIFSFYYRFMLPKNVIEIPRQAYNMHGSLLPKYRGRAPTNWALVHGEKETGATLHLMTAKADAGLIADQEAFAIGPNDTAKIVFDNTLAAAGRILQRTLHKILLNKVEFKPNPIEQGSYFGRRTPADGELKATMSTQQMHDLVRAVAPPFPGAFLQMADRQIFIYRTVLEPTRHPVPAKAAIYEENGRFFLQKEPGVRLEILDCGFAGQPISSAKDFFKNHRIPWSLA